MRRFVTVVASMLLLYSPLSVHSTVKAASASSVSKSGDTCKDYDVFVLRHFEKEEAEGKDPNLSKRGQSQAKKLSQLPMLKGVSHGFYTPYKRTYQTLEHLDIQKSVYDPSQPESLIEHIKNNYCGKSVVIAGHSNTVPDLVKLLGGRFVVSYAGQSLGQEPVIHLSESDYGSVFRVTLHNERLHQQLYKVDDNISSNTELK